MLFLLPRDSFNGYSLESYATHPIREAFLHDFHHNDVPIFYLDPQTMRVYYHDILITDLSVVRNPPLEIETS